MITESKKLILLCAGGTGGHLFPAESLAVVLERRGLVELHLEYGSTGRPTNTYRLRR